MVEVNAWCDRCKAKIKLDENLQASRYEAMTLTIPAERLSSGGDKDHHLCRVCIRALQVWIATPPERSRT